MLMFSLQPNYLCLKGKIQHGEHLGQFRTDAERIMDLSIITYQCNTVRFAKFYIKDDNLDNKTPFCLTCYSQMFDR